MDELLDPALDEQPTSEPAGAADAIDPAAVAAAIERMTICALRCLDVAESRAGASGRPETCTEDLLLAIASADGSAGKRALESVGLDAATLRDRLTFIIGPALASDGTVAAVRSPRVDRVILLAHRDATKRVRPSIGTLNLLMGIVRERQGMAVAVLEVPGVGLERIGGALARAFREEWSDDEE